MAHGAPGPHPRGGRGLRYVRLAAAAATTPRPVVYQRPARQLIQPGCLGRPPDRWGNGHRTGLASYHFVAREQAYISYEHPDCAAWPPLDNGAPVPARMPFDQMSWDEDSRTWTGSIEWEGRTGTTCDAACWLTHSIHSMYTAVLSRSVGRVGPLRGLPLPGLLAARGGVVRRALFQRFTAGVRQVARCRPLDISAGLRPILALHRPG
jgi:hypothetical protein